MLSMPTPMNAVTSKPHRARVDRRVIAADHARDLELAHALQDRLRRESNAFAQLHQRSLGVQLQRSDDTEIDRVWVAIS